MGINNDTRIKLIVVDDDRDQAIWVSWLLSSRVPEQVEMLTFNNAVAAQDHLAENWVDMIITDLDMPDVDGLSLVRRAKEFNPLVQVVIMTAASTSEALVSAGDIGVADYMLKPVDVSVLTALIEQAVERIHRWRRALKGTLALQRLG